MFGTNPIRKQSQYEGVAHRYHVQEVFPTIQGEGPLAGSAAVFVRMAGCNLRCHFCDTDFESSDWRPNHDELLVAIYKAAFNGVHLVVFTGGEPMLQPLGPIVSHLIDEEFQVQYETAGSIWDTTLDEGQKAYPILVCSPKTGNIHAMVKRQCLNYKYIVRVGDEDPDDGLPCHGTQAGMETAKVKLYRPETKLAQIWVQPMEEYKFSTSLLTNRVHMPDAAATKRNVDHAVHLCLTHGYRLSLQTHKMIGLR